LILNGSVFGAEGRGELIEHKMCVLIFSATLVGEVAHYEKN